MEKLIIIKNVQNIENIEIKDIKPFTIIVGNCQNTVLTTIEMCRILISTYINTLTFFSDLFFKNSITTNSYIYYELETGEFLEIKDLKITISNRRKTSKICFYDLPLDSKVDKNIDLKNKELEKYFFGFNSNNKEFFKNRVLDICKFLNIRMKDSYYILVSNIEKELTPDTQLKFLTYIYRSFISGNNKILFTTNSPYILNYLNILIIQDFSFFDSLLVLNVNSNSTEVLNVQNEKLINTNCLSELINTMDDNYDFIKYQ